MASPLYPDVPQAPGVPPLASYAQNAAISVGAGLIGDLIDGTLISLAGPWGIFDGNGNQVVIADTVGSVEFGRDYVIATAPQEQGSFQSYNKVSNPFTIRLLMFCGGLDADRAAFFAALDAVSASTNLYTVLTPEVAYPSANVIGYRYVRRQDRGAYLIGAEVAIEEVRVTASAQLSNTAQPDGSPTQSTGSVQPGPLSDSDTSTIAAGGFY